MTVDSLETLELEMAILVRRITSVTSDNRKGSLDRAAYLILHHVSVQGSAGVKALATELLLDISTISRQAAALEQKGYVNKLSDPLDGRAHFYRISDLGTKELVKYKQARLENITKLLDGWSDEECQQFGQLLKKLNQALRKKYHVNSAPLPKR